MNKQIEDVLNSNNKRDIKALFYFDRNTDVEFIRRKFIIWSRYFFPQFFSSKDAPFHEDMDIRIISIYKNGDSFLNIAFRNSAKTTRTKLFIAFAIANDGDHFRKYFKIVSKDFHN